MKKIINWIKGLFPHLVGLAPVFLYGKCVLGITHESFLGVIAYGLCFGFYSATVCFWEGRNNAEA